MVLVWDKHKIPAHRSHFTVWPTRCIGNLHTDTRNTHLKLVVRRTFPFRTKRSQSPVWTQTNTQKPKMISDDEIEKTCSLIENWKDGRCAGLVSTMDEKHASIVLDKVLPHPLPFELCFDPNTFFLCDKFMKRFCTLNPDAVVCGCYTGTVDVSLASKFQATAGCRTGVGECSNDCSKGPCHTEQACALPCWNKRAVRRPSLLNRKKPSKCPLRVCSFDSVQIHVNESKTTDSCLDCNDNCVCIVFDGDVADLKCGPNALCLNGRTGERISCRGQTELPTKKSQTIKRIAKGSDLPTWFVWLATIVVVAFCLLMLATSVCRGIDSSDSPDRNKETIQRQKSAGTKVCL